MLPTLFRHTFLIILIFGSVSNPSFAKDYYVAVNGNDNVTTPTLSQPLATIQNAVGRAVAGDTVYVRGGTYVGSLRFAASGSPGAPITLKNYQEEKVILDIQGGHDQPGTQVLLQAAKGDHFPIGWITIEGIEILNGYVGIKMYNAHNVIIRGNRIFDCATQGILGNGNHVTVDGNIIARTGLVGPPKDSNQEHGMYFTGNFNIVTNNLFHSNLAYGLQVAAYPYSTSEEYADPSYAEAHGWLISNNVFAYQHNRGGLNLWQKGATDHTIQNNIFYHNNSLNPRNCSGITFVEGGGSNTTVRNNLIFPAPLGGTVCGASAGTVYQVVGKTITEDPLVALSTQFDFRLTQGSQAIDAGTSELPVSSNILNPVVLKDFDGTSRPRGTAIDIGMYEYNSAALPTIPMAPTRLQAQ